jgi:hypothetical protein
MRHLANRFAFLGLLLLTLLTMAGCEEGHHADLITESKEVGEFHAIEFNGVAELNITVGQPASLAITGDKDAVQNVESGVHDGKLYLRYKHRKWDRDWFGPPRKLKIDVSTPSLNEFQLGGAGSVHISGLDGGEQQITASGAYNVQATGKLDRLEITLNGTGNIQYDEVVAQNVKVTVNGAGNVEVQPVQTLDARVNGVGAVQYRGEPQKVNSAIHGLGAIERK